MNIVEKYYMKKASMGMNDEFYEYIEERDIQILKKAQIYLFIAPTMTVAIIYLLNKLRYELLMSQHFFYMIKKYQDKMQSKYQRREAQQQESATTSETSTDPENLKSVYGEIEAKKQADEQAKLEHQQQILKQASIQQNQNLRNIDPFEKKRRLATLQSATDFSSRKVTSRREENQQNKLNPHHNVNPSEYMNISRESYYQEFEKPKGSIYSQHLNEQQKFQMEGEEAAAQQTVRMSKQRNFLRGLRFNFIKDGYNRTVGNPGSQRKIQFAMYAIPAAVSFGLAASNYLQQSFGIYLKYQALVDSYYLKQKGEATNSSNSIIEKQQELLQQMAQQQKAITAQ